MELVKFRTKLSDQEALLELESLKANLGWQHIYNWLIDEIDAMGEAILDDLVLKKMDPEQRMRMELERYLYKQMLQLPDKMQEDILKRRETPGEMSALEIDPYQQ